VSDILSCGSPTEWETWLTAHWQRPTGVWLKIAKKGSRVASVTANEALDVALCYGWIDGTRRHLDEMYYLQGGSAPPTNRAYAATWSSDRNSTSRSNLSDQ
jgi:uncharacterized protein YdeI (YjbR/CyaY-like superfamily)